MDQGKEKGHDFVRCSPQGTVVISGSLHQTMKSAVKIVNPVAKILEYRGVFLGHDANAFGFGKSTPRRNGLSPFIAVPDERMLLCIQWFFTLFCLVCFIWFVCFFLFVCCLFVCFVCFVFLFVSFVLSFCLFCLFCFLSVFFHLRFPLQRPPSASLRRAWRRFRFSFLRVFFVLPRRRSCSRQRGPETQSAPQTSSTSKPKSPESNPWRRCR